MNRAYQIIRPVAKDELYENPLTLIANQEGMKNHEYEVINRRVWKDSRGQTLLQVEFPHRDGIPSEWYEVR
jgi:hypothetical protein